MLIARSTFSRMAARGGDKARETLYSARAVGAGRSSACDKEVSPNASEPDSASLHNCRLINLPKMAKSVTKRRPTCRRSLRIGRGDWGERASKEYHQVQGDLTWIASAERAVVTNETWEYITTFLPCQKSDRPIVATKRGNACGAKGPNFSHVTIKIRRSA